MLLAVNSGPTVQRRIGRELARLREAAGLDQAQAAKIIDGDRTVISKIEHGRRKPRRLELKALLDAYGASADDRDYLLDLAGDTRERGWWTRYTSVISKNYASYIGFEAEADEIWDWEPVTIPGHLQTEEYARALMRGMGPLAADDTDALVEVRMERQRHLAESKPVISAVLDESVLHRVVGTPEVHAGQLARLADAATDPRIEIRVIPYDRGARAVGFGGFTVLSYKDGMRLVWGDTAAGDSCMEDENPHLCVVAFDHLRSSALGPDASLALIRRTLERSVA